MFPSWNAPAQTCFSPPAGLVGWWKAEGNANDSVGTNNGTLLGGATASTAGMVGNAFHFDGTNGYVSIPDSPVLKPTNVTVEAWVRFTSLNSKVSGAPAGQEYIVFKQNSRSSSFEGYDLSKERKAGKDVFYFMVASSGGTEVEVDSLNAVTNGGWYHIVGVRGSNYIQLYVNGQLQGQATVSFAQNYGTTPLLFGSSGQSSWNGMLAGDLDEVSLYNRALSSNEVAGIYQAGSQGKCGPPSIVTQPQSQTVSSGTTVTFSVSASGATPLSYQWSFNSTILSGATNSSLTLTNLQPNQAGFYAVIVTNAFGSIISSNATLSVSNTLINIDFAGDAQHPEVGPAAAGLAASDYWNPVNVGVTNFGGLQFANGTVSGSGISLSTVTSGYVLGASDQMYNTYDYASAVFTITVTNLPGIYDVYLYGHGNADNQYGTYSLAVDGLSYGTKSTVNGTGWQSSVWQEGVQYVVFHNVTLSNSAQVLTITVSLDAANFAVINGMQLVGFIQAPAVTQQPQALTANAGTLATFNASATGTPPLAYQWLFNGTNLPSATNAVLALSNVQSNQIGPYAVRVTNLYGATLSSNATLTVVSTPPSITTQPQGRAVQPGATATFSVTATGSAPLGYQWLLAGTNLPGATGTSLTLTNIQPAQAGSYAVQVTNSVGSTVSSNATLAIITPLINVDFAGDAQHPEVGTAATGRSTNDYWNPFNVGATSLAGLQFADGTVSGSGILLSTTTSGYVLGASDEMYNTYDYASVGFTITVTNLPGSFDVYLYGHGNADNQYGTYSLAVDSLSYGTKSTVNGTGWQSSVWQEGVQYVVFHNVTLSNSAQVLTITVSLDAAGYTVINGMQIVSGGIAPLAFTQQPQSTSVVQGGTAAFNVGANGTQPLSYQWLFNGTNLPGANGTSLTLTNLQLNQAGSYAVQVSNLYAAITSSNATLTVGTSPSITTQPQPQTVAAGTPAAFNVTAAGTSPLNYQWLFNGTNLPGASGTSLALTNVQPGQAGPYAVLVTNAYGSVLSSNATLTVTTAPPSISIQPQPQVAAAGSTVNFSVTAAGTAPLSYQWLFNTTNLPGATSATLNLTNVQAAQAGAYAVLVTNLYGFVLSSNATLAVTPSPPSITQQPVNQSVGVGATATFNVGVTGSSPFTYQWLFDGTNLPGATSASLVLANVQSNLDGEYAVLVTNAYGSVVSSNAMLLVIRTLINVDFGSYGGEVGPAAVGLSSTDYWNTMAPVYNPYPPHYGSSTNTPFPNLEYASGSPSGSGLVLGPYDTYGTLPYSNPSDAMYNNYFQANGRNIVVTVTNLPPDIYDIFVYGHGYYGDCSGLYNLTVNGLNYGTYSTGNGPGWTTSIWQEGVQYVVFRGVAITNSTQALSLTGYPTGECGAVINGMQIVGGANPVLPAITQQPESLSVSGGGTAAFSVAAMGSQPLSYQWLLYGTNLPGATGSSLTLANVQSNQAGPYTVQVINPYGYSFSSNATLTVVLPPLITQQPQNQIAVFGGSATFNVGVLGASPLGYQWFFNGASVPGATNAALTLTNGQAGQVGTYAVQITNAYGSTLSSNAVLSLSQALINVNFDADPQNAKAGPAATGISTNDYWNPLYNLASSITNLLYSDGFASGGGLSLGSYSGTWTLGVTDAMYNTYLFNWGPLPLTVSNLLPSVYDVYIYGHGNADNQYATYSVTVDSVNYGTNSTVNGPGWSSPVWQQGIQYVLFSGVVITNAGQVLNVSMYQNPFTTAELINGMQILQHETPTIVAQPQAQSLHVGGTATFSVTAMGPPPLGYQWLFNGTNLPGATSASLTIMNAQTNQVGPYAVLVSNSFAAVLSSNASLTVSPMPLITSQPQNQTVGLGSSATFNVIALGTQPLSYQWLFNGTNLPGATSASLILTNAQPNLAGPYAVFVTNASGSVLSSNATLSVISSVLINVDFAADPQHSETGLAATGLSPNDYWNPLIYPTSNIPSLLYANGMPSGGRLSVDIFSSEWSLGASDSMYNNYLFRQNGNITITVSNLPPFTNDIYLYGHGNADNQYGVYSLTVDGVNYGTNSTVNGPGWASPVWQAGVQYVVFRSVPITSPTQTLTISAYVDTGGYSIINGMQIVGSGLSPAIMQQPQSGSVLRGGVETMSVGAVGTPPLNYQWLFNGTNLPAATNALLTLNNAQLNQAGTYAVQVTNNYGFVLSSNVTLTIVSGPAITTQPRSQIVATAATATFNVTATGTLPLGYQWRFNGTNLPAATNATLTVTNVGPAQSGTYTVVVSNAYGSVTSLPATLNTLVVSASGGQLTLAWPSAAAGYSLQYTTNLTPPITWISATNAVTTNGPVNSVTLPISGGQAFYRLWKP